VLRVDESPAAQPLDPNAPPAVALPAAPRPLLPAWFALVQVIAICGIPTQLVVVVGLILLAEMPVDLASLSLEFVATVSLLDTALVALLIRVFLMLSGETSRDVFFGVRPVWGEVWRGLLLLPIVFGGVIVLVIVLRAIGPWTHLDKNPLEAYMRTPIDAAIFTVVVVLAGGVREELQRAFILHRFRQRLGGVWVGLALFSLVFGALHIDQGLDAVIAVGLLGVFWGILYIKRGSAVMPMVNHAGFNTAQVIQLVIARALGH
jgi:membrane protease YdiL (CAAX protease family)